MSAISLFFVLWLGGCTLLFVAITGGLCFDRIAVFVLSAINAPVYPEARRVAGLIYQHPEQWERGSLYRLKHQTMEIYSNDYSPRSLYIEGAAFGTWEPAYIERRIIFDAVEWWKRVYIRSLVHKAITS
jgi:hypothetical protein